MIADYHTHTRLCKHAEGDVEEYVRRALDIGLDEVGCSEHMPMPHDFDLRHRPTIEEYTSVYAPQVSEIAEKYKGGIAVRRGIEAEFLPGTEEWVAKFIREGDFDFVIGSVHFVGKNGSERSLFGREYHPEEIETLTIDYFESIRASAMSGMFDIVAHCDLVKKFGLRLGTRTEEAMRESMKAVKRSDLCIEINTSGLRKPEQDTYPGEHVLQIAKELKIPLPLGSDAHKPGQVGASFEKAIHLVEKYGDGEIALFEKRERRNVKVSRLRSA